MGELKTLTDLTKDVITNALSAYENHDESLLPEVDRLEDAIDDLSVEYAKNHIERLKTKVCDPKSGVIFIDMLSDLERSSDHAKNIAFASFPERLKCSTF